MVSNSYLTVQGCPSRFPTATRRHALAEVLLHESSTWYHTTLLCRLRDAPSSPLQYCHACRCRVTAETTRPVGEAARKGEGQKWRAAE